MIKLTRLTWYGQQDTIDSKTIYINPKHIQSLHQNSEGVYISLYETGFTVEESIERVLKLIEDHNETSYLRVGII
jgi:hypothetical protein